MDNFQSALRFRLWEYTVSHSTLLLRHHEEDPAFSIDILFSGVIYLDIPDQFSGLAIATPTVTEEESLLRRCHKGKEPLPDYQSYLLQTGSSRYFVVASSCCVYEHQRGWDSSLLDYWNHPTGKLLYRKLNPAAMAYQQQNPPA